MALPRPAPAAKRPRAAPAAPAAPAVSTVKFTVAPGLATLSFRWGGGAFTLRRRLYQVEPCVEARQLANSVGAEGFFAVADYFGAEVRSADQGVVFAFSHSPLSSVELPITEGCAQALVEAVLGGCRAASTPADPAPPSPLDRPSSLSPVLDHWLAGADEGVPIEMFLGSAMPPPLRFDPAAAPRPLARLRDYVGKHGVADFESYCGRMGFLIVSDKVYNVGVDRGQL